MRYTASPEGFDPIWGVDLEHPSDSEWHTFYRYKMIGRIWKELIHPAGYFPLAAAPPG
jgi:hypothetical protein